MERITVNPDWAKRKPINKNRYVYQRIDPNDLTRVNKQYTSLADILEENECSNTQQIQDAIKEARIVAGYRWNRVAAYEDPTVVPPDFPQTVTKRTKNAGSPVCMINPETDAIERIYLNQRQAADDKSVSHASIGQAIREHNRCAGYQWKFLDQCPQRQIEEYEGRYGKWVPSGSDKIVRQVDPNTRECVKVYTSIAQASSLLHCAPKSIKDAVNERTVFRGFLWERE